MKNNRTQLIRHAFKLLTDKGLKESRDSLAKQFSLDRTDSIGDLSIEELSMLITSLGGKIDIKREPANDDQFYAERDTRMNKSVFGYIYGLHKIAPQLEAVLNGKINQEWLSNKCKEQTGKEKYADLEYDEKKKFLVMLKSMTSNYKKKSNQ